MIDVKNVHIVMIVMIVPNVKIVLVVRNVKIAQIVVIVRRVNIVSFVENLINLYNVKIAQTRSIV